MNREKHFEQWYHSLFENNPDVVYSLDRQGRITSANLATVRLTGYSEQELLSMTFISLVVSEDLEQTIQTYYDTLQGKPSTCRFCLLRKGGERVELYITTVPIHVDGQITGIYIMAKDVTETKRMQLQMQKDLDLAKKVQESVLSPALHNQHISIDAKYLPSNIVGGDMYAWYRMDEHRYGILILDVMGHGVSSSLISMSIRSLLHGLITHARDPGVVMQELNTHMNNLFPNKNQMALRYYFTTLYAVVDVKQQTIAYVNAGHPPALLVDEDGEVTKLEPTCVPVGLLPELTVESQTIHYSGHMRMMLYTDGLFQNNGRKLKQEIERLQEALVRGRQLSNIEFIHTMTAESDQNKVVRDDICLISVDIYKP